MGRTGLIRQRSYRCRQMRNAAAGRKPALYRLAHESWPSRSSLTILVVGEPTYGWTIATFRCYPISRWPRPAVCAEGLAPAKVPPKQGHLLRTFCPRAQQSLIEMRRLLRQETMFFTDTWPVVSSPPRQNDRSPAQVSACRGSISIVHLTPGAALFAATRIGRQGFAPISGPHFMISNRASSQKKDIAFGIKLHQRTNFDILKDIEMRKKCRKRHR